MCRLLYGALSEENVRVRAKVVYKYTRRAFKGCPARISSSRKGIVS